MNTHRQNFRLGANPDAYNRVLTAEHEAYEKYEDYGEGKTQDEETRDGMRMLVVVIGTMAIAAAGLIILLVYTVRG